MGLLRRYMFLVGEIIFVQSGMYFVAAVLYPRIYPACVSGSGLVRVRVRDRFGFALGSGRSLRSRSLVRA